MMNLILDFGLGLDLFLLRWIVITYNRTTVHTYSEQTFKKLYRTTKK